MNSKVVLLALCAAGAACACTSQIVVEPEDTSVKVIMNAQIKTGDEGGFIYLSASTVSDTEELTDATVTVSVNGGAPVRATETTLSDEYYYKKIATPYHYDGTFKPGDHVRFEAITKYGNVSSEVTVPDKVNMSQVDTLRTIIRGSGYTEVNMQFKILVNDRGDTDDYYRLTFFKEECYEEAPGEGKTKFVSSLYGDGSTDPVLSEGTLNTGDLLSELLEMDNSYLIFNDNTFNGQSRPLRVNVGMENLIAGFSYFYPTPDYDTPAYMYVVMEHLSFEQYHYLKAMTNLDNLGYDASFFFEPTTIPSNVEGGLGFVSISTCSDPVKFRIPDDIYFYEIRYREEHPESNPYL